MVLYFTFSTTVLTHRDKFADVDTFNVCKTKLLTALRSLISDMIQKEKLLLKGASKLTKIALFSEPNAEIFPASDIFVSGDAVNSIEFVSQILVTLQTRAEPFLVVIPTLWELLWPIYHISFSLKLSRSFLVMQIWPCCATCIKLVEFFGLSMSLHWEPLCFTDLQLWQML